MSTAELHRQHIERDVRLEQRIARMVMEGEVVGWRPAENRVQLALGEDPQSGERVLSPWVRVPSFGNGGGVQMRVTPRVGQKMVLFSPSGRIGPQSVTMFAPFNPDENPANSSQGQEVRLDVGAASLTVRNDIAELKLGDGSVRIEGGKVTISKGGVSVTLDGSEIVTSGKTRLNNGNKAVHRIGDLDSGGDTAVAGATNVFA